MPKVIKIQDERIALGEQKKIVFHIARLPTGTHIDLPVYVFRAPTDGPVLLLLAGMHGDEINGIETIRRMISSKKLMPKRGTVIAIPLLNIYGFINFSRELPDGKDVNRSFPGKEDGSLASRLTWFLTTEILPWVDYGVDFHTGGKSINNHPQIRCVLSDGLNEELGKAFAPPIIINSPYRDKSLRKEAHKKGKTILVYEGGESMRFDEYAINEGINGTIRLMEHLYMVGKHTTHRPPHQTLIAAKSTWIRAKRSGLFRAFVKQGDVIHKGQVLGSITDPYGEYERKIRAGQNAVVIAVNYLPIVSRGNAVIHLGTLH